MLCPARARCAMLCPARARCAMLCPALPAVPCSDPRMPAVPCSDPRMPAVLCSAPRVPSACPPPQLPHHTEPASSVDQFHAVIDGFLQKASVKLGGLHAKRDD
eukprot:4633563-Prymnesium_polylepis.1